MTHMKSCLTEVHYVLWQLTHRLATEQEGSVTNQARATGSEPGLDSRHGRDLQGNEESEEIGRAHV